MRNLIFGAVALVLATAITPNSALPAETASAHPYTLDGLTLVLPDSFGTAKMEKPAPDASLATFKLSAAGADPRTTLSILSQPSPISQPLRNKDDYVMLTRVCASQWLADIRQHENAWADDTQTTEIGGALATRVHFVAPKNGAASNGFLYCVVLGGRVFKIAARDAGFKPTDNLNLAGHAIEAGQFVKAAE